MYKVYSTNEIRRALNPKVGRHDARVGVHAIPPLILTFKTTHAWSIARRTNDGKPARAKGGEEGGEREE